MPVTIKDIAEYAGVSRGTVDRALNHRSGINPDVAKRILAIAAELGYTPNRAGKALASKKNPIRIGVILNSLGNPFYDQVMDGIHAATREYQDFSVQVHICQLKGYHLEEQLSAIDRMVEQGINAIALTPMNEPEIRDRINQLIQKGLIVVKLNSNIENTEKAVYIGCDYEKSGATAAGLLGLFSGGNAKIGIVTGSVKMLGHTQRVHGFIGACREGFPHMEIRNMAENNDDEEQSYQVTRELLEDQQINALYFTAGGIVGGCRAVDECRPHHRPLVVCCDLTQETQTLLEQGKIHATVCQQPFRQGYESIKTIFNSLMTGVLPEEQAMFMQNEIKIKYNL
ncbi:MAG: LacI family DNA-binding transcriptional regulator [Massiliimalia sp.]